MKKLLLTFMALLLTTASTFATQVEVTMNAKSKLIQSLVNIATSEPVEVGEPTSNKYTFDAPDGSYLLTATAADGQTVSGTIQLDIDANHTTFAIFSPEINVKNTGWVYGTDYTFNLRVTTKEGAVVNTTMGEYTSGKKMFLVFSGNTYYLDMIPSDAHQAEGYLNASYSGTVTYNATVQAEAPMSYAYQVTVPAEATFFLGTKVAHFVKFKEVAPQDISTEGANKVYTFKLADKQQYNYRVSQPGKYTQAGIFTMSGDEAKRPTLVFTDEDLSAKDPKFIDHNVTSNNGYNVGDLFLNINPSGHLKLNNVGDTYDILPMRNWQLVNSITANYFMDPDYHFTVVNLNGQVDNSVVKVENELLTAVGTGTAIVLVTYDAMHVNEYSGATKKDFVGGADWGAIWPENTGVFVVTVGEQAEDITPNITINEEYLTQANGVDTKLSMENLDAEFDVLYYLDTEDGFDYTFSPEGAATVTLARPTIGTNTASYTGFSAEGVTNNGDGSYTLHLTMGRNIVCLTDAAGKSVYQVITAKPCHREIKVGDDVVTIVKPGDVVTVQYSGLYHPAGKLAGIHNFSAGVSYKEATNGITVTDAKKNQYMMASNAAAQAVSFTVPEDWQMEELSLYNGVLAISGFGDPVGNHRATSKVTGRAPNFTAISQSAVFGRLPEVSLRVDLPETPIVVADFENLQVPADGHMSVATEEDDERTEFTSGDFEFATGCMHDWNYWYWFGYANRTDTKYETLDDQWNNIVGGGYNNSANYGVAYAAAFNGPCYVAVNNHGTGAVVPGFYITNSSYAYSSMTNGDGFAKKFDKGDWFKLTITGYDVDGNETGTKDFYLADLRDPSKAYIINDWRYVDLSGLGKVKKLGFELSSSDSGDYGMNTPAYFCFDNFGAEGEEVLPEKNVEFALEVATFENIEVPADGHMSVTTEEDDERTEFTSGDFEFATGCMHDYSYWYFFGYANRTDTKYETLDDQWNNIVGGGYNNSVNYGVAYAAAFNGPCNITVLNHEDGIVVPGFYITNSSYAYSSMTNGDGFAKKFDKGDWFKLTITGYDAAGEVTGTKDFYLADLRDPSKAYIINDWRYVDLSGLGKVKKLGFELTSSDNGDYGMNTPAYFCFDNFGAEGEEVLPEKNVEFALEVATFEDIEIGAEGHMSVSTEDDEDRTEFTSGDFEFATGCMVDYASWWFFGYANSTDTKYETLDDQWNNIVGGGYDGSANYGVAYASSYYGPCNVTVLNHADGIEVPGFYITNSSYAYSSMLNGDAYAKKFGKDDWFKLTITGYDAAGEVTGTKDFYLADLRDDKAYIINDWRYVDLSGLGKVSKLSFALSSTDNGDWGMNTPAYFCFDNFGAEGEEVLPENNVDLTGIQTTNSMATQRAIYDLNGVNRNAVHRGLNIIRMSDGTVRKVVVK